MASTEFPLQQLQSPEQVQLLDDIDKLRSDGVQYHDISLPQIVVCGDQSSGKSSVLEALSNVKFPVDRGTCTRFATELVLRRSPDEETSAVVIPGRKASGAHIERLSAFRPSKVGLAGVPQLIEEARTAMGLSSDLAICNDVLRLEITGPRLPHLTLVDLPGLIADAKHTKEIDMVESMVKTYMKNPRSIILAIVSAQNDKQNQKVLRLAREVDPHGDRTVGIITKPDTLKNYRGSVAERTYLNMAKNQDPVSKLRLGWHVVRNPDYHEKNATYDMDKIERELFSQEPWNELSQWQLGIASLREELTKHLFNQICSELPRVVNDIEHEVSKCEQELKDLGEVRSTPAERRKYLIGISGRFSQLVFAGLEGHWTSDRTFDVEGMRLRAQIRNLNDAFERTMKTKGHTFEYSPANYRKPVFQSTVFSVDLVTASRADLLRKADKILKRGRGQELPGMFDPVRVSEVFRDQSQNWQTLANQHVERAWEITNQFLQDVLFSITPARTSTAEAILNGIVAQEMRRRKNALDAKIAELLLPYVNNVPACTALRMAASLKQFDVDAARSTEENMANSLHDEKVDSEIDIEACSLLLRYSQAYYNIARDTFVDNIITLGIENCLLAGLPSTFSPAVVLDMDEGQLSSLAGESEKMLSDRKYAEEKSRLLKKSLETCRIHMSKRPIAREDSQRRLGQDLESFSLNSDVLPSGASIPASVNTNPSNTGSFTLPARFSFPSSSTGLFGSATSFNAPKPVKPTFSFRTYDDPPILRSSLFGPSPFFNTAPSTTGLFGNTASESPRPRKSSKMDASAATAAAAAAAVAPKASFHTSTTGVSMTSLSAGLSTQDAMPEHTSPSAQAPLAATAATTSQTTQSSSESPVREPQAGTLNRQATSLHRWIPRYYEEDQVIAICRTLSCGDEGSIQIEYVDGKTRQTRYQCLIEAIPNEGAVKSFEELRLEDYMKLKDPRIEDLIHTRNPVLFRRKLAVSQLGNWCRWFMANWKPEGNTDELTIFASPFAASG